MRIKFWACLLHLVIILTIQGAAQQIQGTVKDIDLKPLAGVKVVLLPDQEVVLTGRQGDFSLTLPTGLDKSQKTLQFSKAGFYTNSITLNKFISRADRVIFLVPIEYLTEEISISGLNREEKKISTPIVENSISKLEIKEKLGANIVQVIDNPPWPRK